jgi:hypothetical protein
MYQKHFILKSLRRLYLIFNPGSSSFGRNWKMFSQKEYANSLIYNYLISDKPCMIARFGSSELTCLLNYKGVKESKTRYKDFIEGKSLKWWWDSRILNQMHTHTGFFPPEIGKIEKFCEQMISDISQVNILGSWLLEESFLLKELNNSKRIVLEDMEPFFSVNPWTKALEGKKILVVHPFAETIEQQYLKRELLFENNLLPEFELITIKAVQSIAGVETEFSDWFDALEFMKRKIDQSDYDICIIGAGAYGFPLAAHVKRMGKKAIHLGGVTQLLFGIKGRRWVDNPILFYPYINLYNEHWTYPSLEDKPTGAGKVEDACYW